MADVGASAHEAGGKRRVFASMEAEASRRDVVFEDLAETVPCAILLVRDGRIVSANSWAERLTGRCRPDLVGTAFDDLFDPDTPCPLDPPRVGSSGPSTAREWRQCRLVDPDGRQRTVDVSQGVVAYEGLPTTVVSLVDVTEHERARTAVRAGEDFLRNIFDAIQDGITVLDRDLNIVRVNRTMETWFKDRLPLIGKKCYEVYHACDSPCPRCPTLRTFEKKELQMEVMARAGHGPGGWLELYAFPLLAASGDVTGVVEYSRDITRRKEYENELLDLNARLAEARDQALAASRAKSNFLANMSHELRTPLNAIIGFSRILLRKSAGVLPEKQTRNLETILRNADDLLDMINGLLDLSKIEAGRMDVVSETFDLREVVHEAALTIEPLIESNGTRFATELSPDLPLLRSDRTRVRQILVNLLSNAAKFTKGGRVTVEASLLERDAAPARGGPFVSIEVADTGIGMTSEQLSLAFQEFRQADQSTTSRYGGTGLGLPIVRSLTRLLGGEVRARSEVGKGSVFTVDLPVHLKKREAVDRRK
ncbi:PAS domain S-box protein [Candidatus Sumerlaeota bacterium]|nr:PAS domain S-box protein [Candidatus Sumerlaeota bacterium]